MDVSIIYVNWNCADEIVASVASVRAQTQRCEYEIIVVDNNSPQAPEALADIADIQLILNPENRGFGAGCNVGARTASGRYLLFLNPDTLLLNDGIAELMNFMEAHPAAAVAGPMVVNKNYDVLFEGGRSLPTLFNEFLQHSSLAFRFPNGRFTSLPYLSRWDHRSTRQVETVQGACMLIRADLFRSIGGFDEKFFLYAEELDLCCRLRKCGSEIWYVHTARLVHKERQSTMQLFGSVGQIVLQNMRSQNYYFAKHYGKVAALLWRHMVAVLYLLRFLLGRDKMHLEYFKWAISPEAGGCSAL